MKVDELPGELRRLAELVDQQPAEVRQAFQFCLAVAMEEDGSAKLVNAAQVDGRTWYSYEALSGEAFSVVRPKIDAETEKKVREWVVKGVGGGVAPYNLTQGGPCHPMQSNRPDAVQSARCTPILLVPFLQSLLSSVSISLLSWR